MISDLVEVLDRQHAFMRSLDHIDYLLHLPRYVATLARDARIGSALDELMQEAVDTLAAINDERRALADEAARLRDRYLELFPSEDDRGAEHDVRFNADASIRDRTSIRRFDALVANHALRWPDVRLRDRDADPLQTAVTLLSSRLPDDPDDESPVRQLGVALGNHQRKRAELQRRYDLHCFASPAVAAVRTKHRAMRLTPPADIYENDVDLGAFLDAQLGEAFSFDGLTRRVIYGQPAKGDDVAFEKLAPSVRADLDLVHEELRARIALRRSLLTVVYRYRTRAQWYDAAALRSLAGNTKRSEDALTAHFARFMHDSGLNPLTRPMLGPLQPDLFDAHSKWSFYVEAKQYRDSSPRTKLVRGMHQVWDTLGQQRGTPYEVREAFYLIFRLGGPRVVMPNEVRSEGSTVYPVLIDIADAKAMGSRQKEQPIVIASQDLIPQIDAPAVQPVRRSRNAARTR